MFEFMVAVSCSMIEALMSLNTQPSGLLIVAKSTLSSLRDDVKHVVVELETASSACWLDIVVVWASR